MRRDRASQFLERGLVELALARQHLDFPFQQVAGMSDDLQGATAEQLESVEAFYFISSR